MHIPGTGGGGLPRFPIGGGRPWTHPMDTGRCISISSRLYAITLTMFAMSEDPAGPSWGRAVRCLGASHENALPGPFPAPVCALEASSRLKT